METLLALVAVLVLWTMVVGLICLFMVAMVWLTSRIVPLTGRRKRR